MQIAAAADVLFVFGSADQVGSKIKDLSGQLKGEKIVVPVLSSGTFAAGGVSFLAANLLYIPGTCAKSCTAFGMHFMPVQSHIQPVIPNLALHERLTNVKSAFDRAHVQICSGDEIRGLVCVD